MSGDEDGWKGLPELGDLNPSKKPKASPWPEPGASTSNAFGASAASSSSPTAAPDLPNPFSKPVNESGAVGLVAYPRSGNYIFTVGKPGSGKTTLQSHLLRYLLQSGEHIVELDPEFAKLTPTFNRILSEWRKSWEVGRFPRATEANRPSEFRYRVTPQQPGKPPLDFGFIEISGEDFRDLQRAAETGRHPRLDDGLNAFLANKNCNLAFMFVANGENVSEDDHLFTLFLDYLDGPRFKERDFKNTSTAILVIANPEQAIRRLEKHWREKLDADEISREDLTPASFAETFVAGTASRLKGWDPNRRGVILPYSVGIIESRYVDNQDVAIIAEPSFRHPRALYRWLYKYFTGQTLGPSTVHRIFRTFLDRLNGIAGE